ncbi:MAG: flagellar biosynthesis regulator FlaF [Nitrospirae bacterium]|nr:flagellar biosynthesis regulator FlaF [Nitrospirota bacterium]NTW66488.1 flagellar biosynthesis regulator FlaF [Nitrospirota bacterium]
MYANQLETYRSVQKATMSDREIEACVLTKAAHKLKYCQDNWDADTREATLDEALKFNQLMWSIFQGELLKPDNPMPKKLREDILSLSAFIDKRIFDIMAYPAPEKLAVIININLNLAAGLRGSPQ